MSAVSRPERASGARRERAGALLADRLRERRAEIEQAILDRAYGVSDPGDAADPEYVHGLRAAIGAAIDYGLAGLEIPGGKAPQTPPILLVQARMAARNEVSLDTVLRRYFAGYALFGDFVLEEAQVEGNLRDASLKRLLRAQATLFDRLLAAVSEEHGREGDERLDTAEERRAELVARLLAAEQLDAAELAYDLDASHLGLVAKGPGAPEAVRELATTLDRRQLILRRPEGTIWAWLGGRRPLEPATLERLAPSILPPALLLATGEPGHGPAGWRLTHRQARAALSIAVHRPEPFTRYADIALPASMLQDDLLVESLRWLYLAPLSRQPDGGVALRHTLRAYFTAGRNVSSAAAALGVSRQTTAKRLRSAEELVGRSLAICASEMEAALRLEEYGVNVTRDSRT